MWRNIVLFSGSVIWSARTVYSRNDGNMDVYIGIERESSNLKLRGDNSKSGELRREKL